MAISNDNHHNQICFLDSESVWLVRDEAGHSKALFVSTAFAPSASGGCVRRNLAAPEGKRGWLCRLREKLSILLSNCNATKNHPSSNANSE
jgi:hypothetical protein